jgi:hypothetical protein
MVLQATRDGQPDCALQAYLYPTQDSKASIPEYQDELEHMVASLP